jgi:hypothetical protein
MATTAIVVPSAKRGGMSAYLVHFTWNANPSAEGVTGYKLYPSRVSGSFPGPATDMGNNTTGTYAVPRPSGNGIWYFALTAYTAAGLSSIHSSQVSINIS